MKSVRTEDWESSFSNLNQISSYFKHWHILCSANWSSCFKELPFSVFCYPMWHQVYHDKHQSHQHLCCVKASHFLIHRFGSGKLQCHLCLFVHRGTISARTSGWFCSCPSTSICNKAEIRGEQTDEGSKFWHSQSPRCSFLYLFLCLLTRCNNIDFLFQKYLCWFGCRTVFTSISHNSIYSSETLIYYLTVISSCHL